ncbi:MAG: zinc finger MYND domain-containing protein [Candidatus Dependentiae bacterium]|nr:zinc finger MYND domain-containing protein [Candidatus Dependentiae bacterium]
MKNNKVSALLLVCGAFLSSGNLFCAAERADSALVGIEISLRDQKKGEEFMGAILDGSSRGVRKAKKIEFSNPAIKQSLVNKFLPNDMGESYSPLMISILKDQPGLFEFLINSGAAIDAQSEPKGHTPLMIAIMANQSAMAKELIEKGADLRIETTDAHLTALELTCKPEHRELGELILSKIHASLPGGVHRKARKLNEYLGSLNGVEVTQPLKVKCSKCLELEESPENKFKKCSKCESVYYCSRDCQVAHWPQHKQVCKAPEVQESGLEQKEQTPEVQQSSVGKKKKKNKLPFVD